MPARTDNHHCIDKANQSDQAGRSGLLFPGHFVCSKCQGDDAGKDHTGSNDTLSGLSILLGETLRNGVGASPRVRPGVVARTRPYPISCQIMIC